MIDPTKDDIGRSVIYMGGVPHEEGVITSFNQHFVFVRYRADKHSQATARHDLAWAFDARYDTDLDEIES